MSRLPGGSCRGEQPSGSDARMQGSLLRVVPTCRKVQGAGSRPVVPWRPVCPVCPVAPAGASSCQAMMPACKGGAYMQEGARGG